MAWFLTNFFVICSYDFFRALTKICSMAKMLLVLAIDEDAPVGETIEAYLAFFTLD